MSAGERSEYLELQTFTEVSDPSGEDTESWATLGYVWAKLVPMNARERQESGTIKDSPAARFTFPNNAPANTVNNDDRVIWNSKTMRVVGVDLAAPESQNMTITAEVIDPPEA